MAHGRPHGADKWYPTPPPSRTWHLLRELGRGMRWGLWVGLAVGAVVVVAGYYVELHA